MRFGLVILTDDRWSIQREKWRAACPAACSSRARPAPVPPAGDPFGGDRDVLERVAAEVLPAGRGTAPDQLPATGPR